MKKIIILTLVLLLLISVLSTSVAIGDDLLIFEVQLSSEDLNIRSAKKGGTIIGKALNHHSYTVIEVSGNHAKIVGEKGIIGWIYTKGYGVFKKSTSIDERYNNKKPKIYYGSCYVRAKHDTNVYSSPSKIICTVPAGSMFLCDATDGEFARIYNGSYVGFAKVKDLTIVSS